MSKGVMLSTVRTLAICMVVQQHHHHIRQHHLGDDVQGCFLGKIERLEGEKVKREEEEGEDREIRGRKSKERRRGGRRISPYKKEHHVSARRFDALNDRASSDDVTSMEVVQDSQEPMIADFLKFMGYKPIALEEA
ncbi:hypothetical protein JHK87_039548 [Glycine soja]|nr:hypothetical protein JHK87_039548 [Glycine soja]